MADPISIIGLLGTAATLTKTVLDYASSVKDAPNELENLSRELENLHKIFERLIKFVESEDSKESFAEVSTLYSAAGDLVIKLENLRAKLEEINTAKGLRKVYNRLKWPIDGADTQKLLQTIQRCTQMIHFALTAEGSRILSQVSGKASEMLRASQRTSQAQSDILRAVVALPDHTAIMAELKKLHSHLDDDQKRRDGDNQDFLRQLSTLDFTAMQKESYSKRHANTGHWLLESSDFQSWLKSEDGQNSVLWCPGNPGVGKTVITSIAVNHITEKTGGRRSAIVYIYCDYANVSTFSVGNLLGSIVRQLVMQTSHEGTIAELKTFLQQTVRNRNMTEEEIASWTETLSKTFDVVFTFVDALDECPEIGRDSFLTRIQQYSVGNMRIFLTSRFNVDVTAKIPHAIQAGIAATSHDITAYVESKIHESGRLARFTARDPELKRHIIDKIVSQADGMFLLPGLQIEDLSNQTSPRGVRSALETLPADIFTMYDRTIERIRDQSKKNAELGLKVLSMMFSATETLRIDGLRHALAVQPGDTVLDFAALIDVDILLSVTAGLVITYQDDGEEQESFRLVHYTLQRVLGNQSRAAVSQLGTRYGKSVSFLFVLGRTWKRTMCYRDDFYFYHYAANNWVDHLRGVQMKLMDQSLAFVQDSAKISAWLQSFMFIQYIDIGTFGSEDLPLDPVFLTAHFHLSELFTQLISSRDINTRNNYGETPLIRAVDVEPREKGGKNAFVQSLDATQHAMVQLILDLNADIDAKDHWGMTAAFHAVRNEDSGILSLLLDRGADINALTEKGVSMVHVAANHSTSAMLKYLVRYGAPFDIADAEGVTPLLLAAGAGARRDCVRLQALKALIERGARLDTSDSMGMTPLHFAVSLWEFGAVAAVDLVMQTQTVNMIDIKGRTPLHHAYFRSAQISVCDSENRKTFIAGVIRLLIDGGASETIADADERMPIEYSCWSTPGHHIKWTADYRNFRHAPPEYGKYRSSHEAHTKNAISLKKIRKPTKRKGKSSKKATS